MVYLWHRLDKTHNNHIDTNLYGLETLKNFQFSNRISQFKVGNF